MNRKQRRAMQKQLKKNKGAEEALAEDLMMFDKLPDACDACLLPFDKKDREMVFSWNVVVRKDIAQVRLYCPRCWDVAQEAVKKVYGDLDDII